LQIVVEKCFVCTASNTRHNNGCTGSSYGISNQTFASVDSVRELGVIINYQLKFDKHVADIVHKAMNRANLILKSFHYLFTKAFSTYVRPLLEYCSPVWSPHFNSLINKNEKVQRYFTKRMTGLWNVAYHDRLVPRYLVCTHSNIDVLFVNWYCVIKYWMDFLILKSLMY